MKNQIIELLNDAKLDELESRGWRIRTSIEYLLWTAFHGTKGDDITHTMGDIDRNSYALFTLLVINIVL